MARQHATPILLSEGRAIPLAQHSLAGGPDAVTVYRNVTKREVGLFLSYTRGSEGERIVQRIIGDWDAVQPELGGSALVWVDATGEKSAGSKRTLVIDKLQTGSLADPTERTRAFDWLRARTNAFVNALRPRVRATAADLELEGR